MNFNFLSGKIIRNETITFRRKIVMKVTIKNFIIIKDSEALISSNINLLLDFDIFILRQFSDFDTTSFLFFNFSLILPVVLNLYSFSLLETEVELKFKLSRLLSSVSKQILSISSIAVSSIKIFVCSFLSKQKQPVKVSDKIMITIFFIFFKVTPNLGYGHRAWQSVFISTNFFLPLVELICCH